jgi:hypothetical protein
LTGLFVASYGLPGAGLRIATVELRRTDGLNIGAYARRRFANAS